MDRKFEFKQGSSAKFWQVTVDDKAVTFRYGKIGTKGQVKTKEFADADKALKEAEKKIAEKEKKGYLEVGEEGSVDDEEEHAGSASPAHEVDFEQFESEAFAAVYEDTGFEVPGLYQKLYDDDFILQSSFGVYDDSVEATLSEYEGGIPLLLYSFDFLGMSPEEILEHRNEHSLLGEEFDEEHLERLLVFATGEQGDEYCFYYGESGEILGIAHWHPEDGMRFVAKDLQEFIFEFMVEAFDHDTYADEKENQLALLAMLRSHGPYLRLEHFSFLAQLYSETSEDNRRALIEGWYKANPSSSIVGRELSADDPPL